MVESQFSKLLVEGPIPSVRSKAGWLEATIRKNECTHSCGVACRQATLGEFESRTVLFLFLADSTQGERARLLTENEAGSIPALPAIFVYSWGAQW